MKYIPEIIFKHLKGREVLDIGISDIKYGWHKQIVEHSFKAMGIDINKEFIEQHNANGYNTIIGDITKIDLKKRFDVVLSGETIEHIQDQEAFMKGIKKHLKVNGMIIITTPNANSILNTIYNIFLRTIPETTEHIIAHRITTLTNLLREHQLKITKVFYYNQKQIKKKGLKMIATKMLELIMFFFTMITPESKSMFGVIAIRENIKYKEYWDENS